MNGLMVSALKLASRGWPVFPCAPGKKSPAVSNGLKDATTSVERIVRWWEEHPDCNVGLCTGSRSRVVVLDIDGEEGVASLNLLERENGTLPRTLSVCTPSGGEHYYFTYSGADPFRNTAGRLGLGVDTRGEGGYVLVPPSAIDGRPYTVDEQAPLTVLPEWLLRAAQPQLVEGSQDSAEWLSIMGGAREGERNHAIARLTGYLLRRYVHLDVTRELIHIVNQHRFAAPLSTYEVNRTIDSILELERRRREAEGT